MKAHDHKLAANLVILVKRPVSGRVKTRLGHEIGTQHACQYQRLWLSRLLHRLNSDSRFIVTLALSPDRAMYARLGAAEPRGHSHKRWQRRCAQGNGDLGQRLWRRLSQAQKRPMLVIGADSPRLRPQHLGMALARRGSCDFVLGSASDGGYWLIGRRAGLPCKRPLLDNPLNGVSWSSSRARADTIACLRAANYTVRVDLPILDDVDDLSSLRRHFASTSLYGDHA